MSIRPTVSTQLVRVTELGNMYDCGGNEHLVTRNKGSMNGMAGNMRDLR